MHQVRKTDYNVTLKLGQPEKEMDSAFDHNVCDWFQSSSNLITVVQQLSLNKVFTVNLDVTLPNDKALYRCCEVIVKHQMVHTMDFNVKVCPWCGVGLLR